MVSTRLDLRLCSNLFADGRIISRSLQFQGYYHNGIMVLEQFQFVDSDRVTMVMLEKWEW